MRLPRQTIISLLTVCGLLLPSLLFAQSGSIYFDDDEVKSLCVSHWDTNGDGELSYAEAAAVTDLGTVFKDNTQVFHFLELQYFTSLTKLSDECFRNCTNLRSVALPVSVDGVGDRAFHSCVRLSEVYLNEGLLSLGNGVFTGCSTLSVIELPSTLTEMGPNVFYSCRNLSEVNIPDGVTAIRSSSFYGCTSLQQVILPNTVRSLASTAFRGCSALTKVTMPVVLDASYLPLSVSDITLTFVPSTPYQTLCTPNRVDYSQCEDIEVFVATGYENRRVVLEQVYDVPGSTGVIVHALPGHLYELPLHHTADVLNQQSQRGPLRANRAATNYVPGEPPVGTADDLIGYTGPNLLVGVLEDISLPAQQGTRQNFVFSTANGHYSFTVVATTCELKAYEAYLPLPSVEVVGLSNIWVPFDEEIANNYIYFADETVKQLSVAAFDGNGDGEVSFDEAAAVTNLGTHYSGSSIKQFNELVYFTGLTTLPEECFWGCDNLRTVMLPPMVKTVGPRAFYGCFRLASISLPEGLTSIGDGAFTSCTGLKEIVLPQSVRQLGPRVFYFCKALQSVNIPEGVKALEAQAFSNCQALTSLTLPSTMTSVASNAFVSCSALTYFSMPAVIDASLAPKAVETLELTIKMTADYISYCSPNDLDYSNIIGMTAHVADAMKNGGVVLTEAQQVPAGQGIVLHGEADSTYVVALSEGAALDRPNMLVGVLQPTIADPAQNPGKALLTLYVRGRNVTFRPLTEPTEVPAFSAYLRIPQNEIAAEATSINTTFVNLYTIHFFDKAVKNICIAHWDTDGNGELSYDEAAAVTDLGQAFTGNKEIVRFTELQYFTGLTSVADSAFSGCTKLKDLLLPITVRQIGTAAFSSCYALTEMDLPDGIESIGASAFIACTNLQQIALPESALQLGSRAFYYCTRLVSATLPSTLKELPSSMFQMCSSLDSIYLPPTMEKVGNYAFTGCSHLRAVRMPALLNVNSLPSTVAACYYYYTLPSSWSTILSPNALSFSSVKDLKAYIVPQYQEGVARMQSVPAVPANTPVVLHGPAGKEVVFGKGTTAMVDQNLLHGLKADTRLLPVTGGEQVFLLTATSASAVFEPMTEAATLPAHSAYLSVPVGDLGRYSRLLLTADGNILFADNDVKMLCVEQWDANSDGELSISEAAAVTDIGKVFAGNTSINTFEELLHFSRLTRIPSAAFSGTKNMRRVTIPFKVTEIGDSAFQTCYQLSDILLPDGLTRLGNGVFYVCNSLKSIYLPNRLSYIGERAFYYCTSLEGIDIPYGITNIGKSTFNYCSGLKWVVIPESVVDVDATAFAHCKAIETITLPAVLTIQDLPETIQTYRLTHTLKEAFETFSCDYNVDFTPAEGLQAFSLTGIDDNRLVLEPTDCLPAGEGILLHGEAGRQYVMTVGEGSLLGNLLIGVPEEILYVPVDADSVVYCLRGGNNGVGFYRVNNSMTLAANSAYALLPKGLPSYLSFSLLPDIDDPVIGLHARRPAVSTIDTPVMEINGEDVWYTLSGVRLARRPVVKGVYVHNGRKETVF